MKIVVNRKRQKYIENKYDVKLLVIYLAANKRSLIQSCLISLDKSGVASADILSTPKHTWE
jgi:hypothetical protein